MLFENKLWQIILCSGCKSHANVAIPRYVNFLFQIAFCRSATLRGLKLRELEAFYCFACNNLDLKHVLIRYSLLANINFVSNTVSRCWPWMDYVTSLH